MTVILESILFIAVSALCGYYISKRCVAKKTGIQLISVLISVLKK